MDLNLMMVQMILNFFLVVHILTISETLHCLIYTSKCPKTGTLSFEKG